MRFEWTTYNSLVKEKAFVKFFLEYFTKQVERKTHF